MPRLRRDHVPALYAVADADLLGLDRLPAAVAEIARCGIEWIQLRAKHAEDDDLARVVEQALEAASAGTMLWMNDRADVAALYGLPGLHLGQEDLPPGAARAAVGESCWIGRSTHDLAQVAAAAADPEVDVIALGPVFPTRHKENPDPVVGLEGLRRARAATPKPLVAIGGVSEANLLDVLAAGADTAALLGAVCVGDLTANCDRLRALVSAHAGGGGSIYLTGFMGAGKTAVGRRLAARLGLPFLDLDHEIEAGAGRSIPDLFRERGEDAFRALESEALAAASRRPRTVVATGGGVVERESNLGVMRSSGRVVWLDVPFATLVERLARGREGRPLFRNPEQARRLYESRLAAYGKCDLRIAVEPGSSADETAARVERQLAESCGT
ncbi:MAG TPA: thiamine phosphate synthase [Thermoanaerobaculia bacterium]|nr:thiamine phosphate synthase [Thermoanaerobaculia bacterium]